MLDGLCTPNFGHVKTTTNNTMDTSYDAYHNGDDFTKLAILNHWIDNKLAENIRESLIKTRDRYINSIKQTKTMNTNEQEAFDAMRVACRNFVEKCRMGRAVSHNSRTEMEIALQRADEAELNNVNNYTVPIATVCAAGEAAIRNRFNKAAYTMRTVRTVVELQTQLTECKKDLAMSRQTYVDQLAAYNKLVYDKTILTREVNILRNREKQHDLEMIDLRKKLEDACEEIAALKGATEYNPSLTHQLLMDMIDGYEHNP